MVLAITELSFSFSFNGETVPCKGVNVTGYPKMKEQYKRCNKTVYDGYKKRGETAEMVPALLCTAQCVFIEDKLVNTKTGMLNKAGLDNYKEMFDHIPELVRKDIKKVFYDCFETNKNSTVYDAKKPNECSGITNVAICVKAGIDGICNPESADEE
ncbi:uncharacterized protein LOC110863276 isoform X2 [Folsomia candida]|uniref:uncharacterized protein LOC110863276 isoform X2 n=1 Tax=Folsomia candida TaxID=158441 RepID=UPI000B9020B3|nr:uncharacterized protein LOC110863276 isoform X2 [Folsomia candida]